METRPTIYARETPTRELVLQINPHLRVTRVQSQGYECRFSQAEAGRVVVTWPVGTSGAPQVLELDYAGCLPQHRSSEKEARAFINDDFFWLRDDQQWYPAPVGQQPEEMRPVPPGRYMVQVQLPFGWEAAASAPLIRRWHEGQCECYQWDTGDERPGISIVGGRLERRVAGRCTFLWRTPRPDLAEAAPDVLDWYERLLGPYPHPGLTVVIGPGFIPGGYADRGLIYVSEEKPGLRTLAHELVHQWWGRGVGAKRPGDRWLTEGLAEYLALLYLDARNESPLGDMLEKHQAAYLETVALWGDKPIVHVSNEDYQKKGLVSALLYKKGAWLHRMLHLLLGEQYFRALQTMYSRYCGESITTEQYLAELAAHCEEQRETIADLARQWLYAPGLPGWQDELGGNCIGGQDADCADEPQTHADQ